MSLKITFLIYGIYSIIMGSVFIIFPAMAMEGVGIMPTPDLEVTQQIWGAALVGLGVIAISLKEADKEAALGGPARAVMFTAALSVIVTIYHLWLGFSGPPIFMNILIQTIFAVNIFLKTK